MTAKNEPVSGLSYGWDLGEDNWNIGMDPNLIKIGAVMQLSVVSDSVTIPPTIVNGARYLVPTGATGSWAPYNGKLAVAIEGAWTFYQPKEGWLFHVEDTKVFKCYEGGSFVPKIGANAVTSVATRGGDVVLANTDVGLGNVTNDSQVKRSEMGVAAGVATLNGGGYLPTTQLPALAGDITSSAGSATTTLANTAVTAGTYGDSSHVATVTVDAKGRATSVTNTLITPSAIGATVPADLASTSDNTKGVALVGGAGRVVNTIAALKALPKTGSPTAFVLGYYASLDGGGGAYSYDSTDTTSTDNGGTIVVASDGGRWKLQHFGMTTLLQWGAKGDGTTDDATPIQAAITYCGTNSIKLYVPAKTYLINTAVTLATGLIMEGEGWNSTFKCGASITSRPFYGNSVVGCRFSNFTVDMNNVNSGGGGNLAFYFDTTAGTECSDIEFNNCQFINGAGRPFIRFTHGINSKTFRFNFCRFAHNTGAGAGAISFLPPSGVVLDTIFVNQCVFDDVSGGVLEFHGGGFSSTVYDGMLNVKVIGNTWKNLNSSGTYGAIPMELSSPTNALIANNTIDSGTRGFGLAAGKNVTYSGNNISNQSLYAWELGTKQDVTLIGNTIKNCRQVFLADGSTDGLTFVGNTCDGTGLASAFTSGDYIQFSGGADQKNITISGNTFKNPEYVRSVVRFNGNNNTSENIRVTGNNFIAETEFCPWTVIQHGNGSFVDISNNTYERSGNYTSNTPGYDNGPVGMGYTMGTGDTDVKITDNKILFTGTVAGVTGVYGFGNGSLSANTLPGVVIRRNTVIGTVAVPFNISITSGDTVVEDNDDFLAIGTSQYNSAVVYRRTFHVVGNTSSPLTGKFKIGDRCINRNPTSGAVRSWSCTGNSAATTGSITSGTNSLTVTSASNMNIGDGITISGAGASGADLNTTISNIVSTTVTTAANAGTTVSSVNVTTAGTWSSDITSVAGRTGIVTLTNTDVGLSNVTNDSQVKRSEMAAASGVATLDSGSHLLAAQHPALTGDVTTSAGSVATTLATTGVTAASYGSGTAVPVITVDAKGRLTAASTTNIPVMVASGGSHAAGLAPDPGSSAGTTRYLREDGTWVAPPSGTAFPTSTWAGLPSASGIAGTVYEVTNVGTYHSLWQSNGTIWVPYAGSGIDFAKSAVAVSCPADTTEDVLATVTLPAGIMGPNGKVRITTMWSFTGSTNNKIMRVRFGGVSGAAYLGNVQATAANVIFRHVAEIQNTGSASAQIGNEPSSNTSYTVTTAAGGSSSINTNNAVDIVFSGQKASSGETLTLKLYHVELFPG